MGITEEMRFIERPQFFNGQLLVASDLQWLESLNREMRWLHNRSLHQPGVGSGFAVSGKKGQREVRVFPGYAIDADGREIVATREKTLPIPPVAGESDGTTVFFDLTVSYPDDTSLEEVETREGTCSVNGVVRLREEPIFCWARLVRDASGSLVPKNQQLLRDIKEYTKIVLARIEVLECRLEQNVITTQRRNARPTHRPYLECGRIVVPRETKFKRDETGFIDFEVQVDTRAAGFRTVPFYFAHFEGPRNLHDPAETLLYDQSTILKSGTAGFSLLSRVYLRNVGERENLDRNRIPEILKSANVLISDRWKVVWMGIEN
jgi:hypothetical protein